LSPVSCRTYFAFDLSSPQLGGDLRVAEYRAYFIGDDGHFIGFEPMICRDDSEAVTKVKAQRLVEGHDVEIWSRERFVVRLGAEQSKI
jgi:hypothetical protein